jgi:predicted nucleic acid-binding OB-fold protein
MDSMDEGEQKKIESVDSELSHSDLQDHQSSNFLAILKKI